MRLERTQRGYTLLEFLLFTTIFAIVMTAIYLMYSTQHTTFTSGKNQIDVHQHARTALERMAMDIRMAGYDPSGVIPLQTGCCAGAGIAQAMQLIGAADIQFIADVEGSGTAQRVRYRVVSGQIKREIQTWNAGGGGSWNAAASSDLADKVNSLSFTYIDGSDGITGTLADVRRVTIQVILQGTGGESTVAYQLDTDVRLRNLS